MPDKMLSAPELLIMGKSAPTLLLAHGAGAPMTSPFLESFSEMLVSGGVRVCRFEFAYMAARRTGARKPPPRAERLVGEYLAAVEAMRAKLAKGEKLFIGGKSMGGRVASMIADDLYRARKVAGLVVAGYPFHPPGKPENLRTLHLANLTCPTLIVQGERDPFGTKDEVARYSLAPAISFHWSVDGDHNLKPTRASGTTHKANIMSAAHAIADFCVRRG